MTSMFSNQESSQDLTQTREADRSARRAAARTASENLLVSLDESILPPQITKIRPEMSPEGLKIAGISSHHDKTTNQAANDSVESAA